MPRWPGTPLVVAATLLGCLALGGAAALRQQPTTPSPERLAELSGQLDAVEAAARDLAIDSDALRAAVAGVAAAPVATTPATAAPANSAAGPIGAAEPKPAAVTTAAKPSVQSAPAEDRARLRPTPGHPLDSGRLAGVVEEMARPALQANALPAEPIPAAARVVLHHAAANAGSTNVAVELAARLTAVGYPDVMVRRVPHAIGADRLRWFHLSDRPLALALRLATFASATVALQDFTDYRPSPRPGTLELWLADR